MGDYCLQSSRVGAASNKVKILWVPSMEPLEFTTFQQLQQGIRMMEDPGFIT